MDVDKLIKEVGSKSTIEDSVDTLLITIANELMAHPTDGVKNTQLAADLVTHLKALGAAVSDNI